MNKTKLNIGLAGCGHLGSIHAKLISKIAGENSSVEFTGVYDIEPSRANKINKDHSVKSFDTFESMLDEIDTLIIVTPTSTHFKIAEEALKRNINLFIEKPVTSSLKEAE